MKIQNFITDEVGVINEKEIALFNKTLKTLYERDGEDVRFIFISDDICWDSEEDFLLTNNIGDPQRHNGMVFILNIKGWLSVVPIKFEAGFKAEDTDF